MGRESGEGEGEGEHNLSLHLIILCHNIIDNSMGYIHGAS